jgi:hypothetical protein
LTTRAELEAVRFILDKEWPDGTTSDSVARAAVKALDDLRKTSQRPLGGPPKPGMAFKPYWSSDTHYVRWIGDERGKTLVWAVTKDSDNGILTHVNSPIWQYSTLVPPAETKTRKYKVIDPDTGEQAMDMTKTRKYKIIDPDTGEHVRDENGELMYDVRGELMYDIRTIPPITDTLFTNTLGLVPGDKLSVKNVGNYVVEEVFSGGALIRFQDGTIWGESNHDLQRYYKDGWI